MKKILLFGISLLFSYSIFAQEFEYKKDLRPQNKKEDPNDIYQIDEINNLDLIKALEIVGVGIHKFYLGNFDKKYNMEVILEEYSDGKVIETKTLFKYNNTYLHYSGVSTIGSEQTPFVDYIDQLVFYTKKEESDILYQMSTIAMTANGRFSVEKTDEKQFYNWRRYSKTNWKLNEQIPLLVYASSWYDKEYDIQRFCGVVDLSRDEESTKELLTSSPHYFIISYKIYE